jgi:hypothetical protein
VRLVSTTTGSDEDLTPTCNSGEVATGYGARATSGVIRHVQNAYPTVSGSPATAGQTPDGYYISIEWDSSSGSNRWTAYVICMA